MAAPTVAELAAGGGDAVGVGGGRLLDKLQEGKGKVSEGQRRRKGEKVR